MTSTIIQQNTVDHGLPTVITRENFTGADACGAATGYAPRRRYGPEMLGRINEAAKLLKAANEGDKRAMIYLTESLTTSDMPNLLGGAFDRSLMQTYEQLPQVWSQFASRQVVNDFRPKTLIDILGGRARLDLIPERGEYPARAPTESKYALAVQKFGARISLSWEMIINDDLGSLTSLPDRMAQGSRDTEDYLATASLVTAAGPNTAFFKAGNNNAPKTGAGSALSTANLSAALTTVSTRKDSEGRPFQVSAFILMVPPGLEVIANNIVNALQIRDTDATTGRTVIVSNWLAAKVKVVMNPWIPIIDTSGTTATSWYLLPAPSTARPAVSVGFLRGHEVPDVRVADNAGRSLGGGQLSPEDGSFDADDVSWRLRHILGSITLDPIAAFASKGDTA